MVDTPTPDDVEEPEHLSELLRAMVQDGMRDLDMTQYRLAKLTGVSQKHISQLMNGRTAGSLDVWDKLLKAVSARGLTRGGD